MSSNGSTSTYNSWLNPVERWFAELTTKWIKRGAHRSVRASWPDPQLDRQLERRAQALRLAQDADEILESLGAYCQWTNGSGH